MIRRLAFPFLILFFFSCAFLINSKIFFQPLKVSKQEASLNFRSDILHLLSLGLDRLLADLIWIKTLLDSDLDHYQRNDLNSWLYLRFRTIADLDPLFYENYYYGGQYLMIVKNDLLGSEEILQMGLKKFPTDVGINWQLGYLYGIERSDPAGAMKFFDVIKGNPRRPVMFDSLYTKFSANTLGLREAFDYAYSVWRMQPDGVPIKDRLRDQLYTLKAQIDFDCHSKRLPECSITDFDGNPYRKTSNGWTTEKPLINLKLRLPKPAPGVRQ